MVFDETCVQLTSTDTDIAHKLRREKRYAITIKALKGYSTRLARQGVTWEIATLDRVTSKPPASGMHVDQLC